MISPSPLFANPLRTHAPGLDTRELEAIAALWPDRPATPLHESRALADALDLSAVLIKDETARWGLNAFKITGAAYALDRMLADGAPAEGLVCASAGNHGRAVARAARERGVPCCVFLPSDALPARVAQIRDEGADIVKVAEGYEAAVWSAWFHAKETGAVLVADTADDADNNESGVAALIMRGYTRLFSEAARQWSAPPDLVVIQGGVGGLVGAAAAWMRTNLPRATLIAAEPEGSACLMESARAGRRSTLPFTSPTSMVCLRCAEPSAAAWPFIAAGVDAFATVTDAEAAAAVARLAGLDPPIRAGASGACGLAALTKIAPDFARRRALIVVTEGL